jgi:hypothetical protein
MAEPHLIFKDIHPRIIPAFQEKGWNVYTKKKGDEQDDPILRGPARTLHQEAKYIVLPLCVHPAKPSAVHTTLEQLAGPPQLHFEESTFSIAIIEQYGIIVDEDLYWIPPHQPIAFTGFSPRGNNIQLHSQKRYCLTYTNFFRGLQNLTHTNL